MQLLAPALRILARDPIISHLYSGNLALLCSSWISKNLFDFRESERQKKIFFVLDLACITCSKNKLQWRRLLSRSHWRISMHSLIHCFIAWKQVWHIKIRPDLGDFPKKNWSMSKGLCWSFAPFPSFPTPISSAIFIPSQLQILQKCCCTKMIYAMHLFYTKATASFMYRKCNNIFTILVAQRRDHMLDDDLDPLYISEKLWILGNL